MILSFAENRTAVQPPSTSRFAPTTNDASSDARNRTTSAISPGWPSRSGGWRPAGVKYVSRLDAMPSVSGVRTKPGQTALARIRACRIRIARGETMAGARCMSPPGGWGAGRRRRKTLPPPCSMGFVSTADDGYTLPMNDPETESRCREIGAVIERLSDGAPTADRPRRPPAGPSSPLSPMLGALSWGHGT